MDMTDEQHIAYAAGFYEGEGSFIDHYVSITQKDPWSLQVLQEKWGGTLNQYNGYWYLRLFGEEMRSFVKAILPYLSPRRQEQIFACKDALEAVKNECPNGHPYVDGSYVVYNDSRGRSYRQCTQCNEIKTKRNNLKGNAKSKERKLAFVDWYNSQKKT